MDDSSLYLRTGNQIYTSVSIHPVVVLSILDHHIRRTEGHRVIGTLLGVNNDGNIEIKACFPVPHTEGEQVGVDMEFLNNMLELHHRVSPKEAIVGWYATGSEIDDASLMLHEFYGKKTIQSPIHVIVDTNLTDFSLKVKAFVNMPVSFNEKSFGSQFLPLSIDVQAQDAEKIGVDVLMKTRTGDHRVLSDMENLELSLKKVQSLLEVLRNYSNLVVEGKVEGDSNIGRQVSLALAQLPKIDANSFDRIFNNSIQDLLLVVYLADLTRTQLQLAEKLQKVV